MVFSSHAFLVFMLALLAVYAATSRWAPRHCKALLVLASLFFYGFWIPKYLILLGGSLALNYWLSAALTPPGESPGKRRALWAGIALNLGLIAYYKYFDLLLGGVNGLFGTSFPLQHVLLPIGISFFTFQQIAYLVDVAEGKTTRASPLDYAFIIVFFPHLIAGPVVLQEHLLPQVRAKQDWRLHADQVALGLALFSLGLFKKTVLADTLSQPVDAIFLTAQRGEPPGLLDAWLAAVGYSFQIYFDFSGYSDMAVGLAFLWGFRLPMNFYSPYRASSIIEFWRRWHISLSSFLRDYLYIRLGGNRHGFARTMAALMLTMLLGGLWHGAGLQFIAWGGLHGLYLVVNHCWRRWQLPPLPRGLGWLLTYLAVCVAWLYFRAASVEDAHRFVLALVGGGADTSFTPVTRGLATFVWLHAAVAFLAPNSVQWFAAWQVALPSRAFAAALGTPGRIAYRFTRGWAACTALLFTVGWFAISNLSPFLYFQF